MNYWIQVMLVGQKRHRCENGVSSPSGLGYSHPPTPGLSTGKIAVTPESQGFQNCKQLRAESILGQYNAYGIQSKIWICKYTAFARRWFVLCLRFASLLFFAFFCKVGTPQCMHPCRRFENSKVPYTIDVIEPFFPGLKAKPCLTPPPPSCTPAVCSMEACSLAVEFLQLTKECKFLSFVKLIVFFKELIKMKSSKYPAECSLKYWKDMQILL